MEETTPAKSEASEGHQCNLAAKDTTSEKLPVFKTNSKVFHIKDAFRIYNKSVLTSKWNLDFFSFKYLGSNQNIVHSLLNSSMTYCLKCIILF